MQIDSKTISKIVSKILSQKYSISSVDIPNIDLYMDQVTTFMDTHFHETKRYSEDKILTKTMINNYTKNHLLPAPDRKKYSKEHMLVLIFIYQLKNVLSIKDIETLLQPLTEHFFHNQNQNALAEVYDMLSSLEKERTSQIETEINDLYSLALSTLQDTEAVSSDHEFLKLFTFIHLLNFDISMKKQIIEKLIDSLSETTTSSSKDRND